MAYTNRFIQAFSLAEELHRRQHRRGSEVPYITHLMAVASLVGEHGGSEDQVMAALLHDAVEDQGGEETLERIRDYFGEKVAGLVEACSDARAEPKPAWLPRKQLFLDALRTASPEVKLIVAADKLHNVRTLIRDYRKVGESLWDRFTGKREGTLWYYREACRALQHDWDHPILQEYGEALGALEALVTADTVDAHPSANGS